VSGNFVYPDATVICDGVELYEKSDAALNPSAVVEVLSKSTERHDRGDKWRDYQTIPSLTDFVLVSQRSPRIEHFRKDAEGVWTYRVAGPGGRVVLASGATLLVDAMYEGAFELPGDD
jgi:Uma2 family endonuclease